MKKPLAILAAFGIAGSLSLPMSASATAVSLFFNSSYVEQGDEAGNISASLTSFGHSVSTFTGITAADWTAAFAAADAVLIPETGVSGNLAPDLSAGAEAAIAAAVSGGKTLIVTEGESDSVAFLNSIFGFALSGSSTSTTRTWTLDALAASGTAFAGGPASVPSNNSTGYHAVASLPVGALGIYLDAGDASVWTVGAGSGFVTFLGWDWFDAAPSGSQDGGWLTVLDRATMSAAAPVPGTLALVGLGLLAGAARSRRAARPLS